MGIGVHLLQPPIFVLQLLELGYQRRIHAAELAAPLIERCRADAVFAAQLRHWRAGLGLFEHGDDLAVGEAGCLHGTYSEKGKRKFHFWRQLTCGGITLPLRIIFAACLTGYKVWPSAAVTLPPLLLMPLSRAIAVGVDESDVLSLFMLAEWFALVSAILGG